MKALSTDINTDRTPEQLERLKVARDIMQEHNGYKVVEVDGSYFIFDMLYWATNHTPLNVTSFKRANQTVEYCGTSCCAWGVLSIHPKMIDMGLNVTRHGAHIGYIGERRYHDKIDRVWFGLTFDEYWHLFIPEAYVSEKALMLKRDDDDSTSFDKEVAAITPQDVAKHFQDVIDGKVPTRFY